MQKIIYLEKGESAELPAGASEDERLEAAVRWINKKVQSTVHFGLLQVGYYLLNNFFDGKIENALSRNPHKDNSFRKLCRRPDLCISSTHLVNSVKLVTQERLLQRDASFQKLPVSHKIALLSVGDVDEKRQLARRALKENLSVRALTREVKRLKQPEGPEAEEWARKVQRKLKDLVKLIEAPVLEGLTESQAEELDNAISNARRSLQTPLAELRGFRNVAV